MSNMIVVRLNFSLVFTKCFEVFLPLIVMSHKTYVLNVFRFHKSTTDAESCLEGWISDSASL